MITGRPHELLNLKKLVSNLSSDIQRLSVTVIDKEQKLSALLMKANKTISEFEKNTQELLKKLYQTRDDQVCKLLYCIKSYNKLLF